MDLAGQVDATAQRTHAAARGGHAAAIALACFTIFAAVVFLAHLPLLKVPFFWDEAGQFVPAALDLFQHGWWLPHSVRPNVHPPGVMMWLAAVWTVGGYSVAGTRLGMLAVAAAAVFVTFLLSLELLDRPKRWPAFLAAAFLCACPLFFAQSMLAQLDMPATLFTAVALLLFLKERHAASVCACAALVLVKETSIIVPVVFGGWLLAERRPRQAVLYGIPVVLTALWVAYVFFSTGYLFGDRQFAAYNLSYPLHPVRLVVALLRRLYFLFVADLHWVGTVAVIMHRQIFRTRAWMVAGTVVGAYVAFFTLVGGAVLERYMLPAIPVVYAAFAAALAEPPGWLKFAGAAALLTGLALGNIINPPYPFPLENNLAFVDFVRVQQQAARFLEEHEAGRRITTAWPLAPVLRNPKLGYVSAPLRTQLVPNLKLSTLERIPRGRIEVLATFSREWDPYGLLRWKPVRYIWSRFYDYEPEAQPEAIESRLGLTRIARWERRGQWAEVYSLR
jgi:4-amino-4-deoxy-L-arabinose transferase-like glycosyltransferase